MATDIENTTPLLPREQKCLKLYVMGAPKWVSAKLAGYRQKSKVTLAAACTDTIQKAASQGSQEDFFTDIGLGRGEFARNLNWTIRHAKAKRDLKSLLTALKLNAETIGLIGKGMDVGEALAPIIIRNETPAEAAAREMDKKGDVLHIDTQDPN